MGRSSTRSIPKPQFDVGELRREYPDALDFQIGLSLDILPGIEPVDFALVDGDHNWHTVLNELRLLERAGLAPRRRRR